MQYKSNQQVVEKVAYHLGFQFKKSQKRDRETHRNSCLYRGPNNTMCAAGCLIPDEFYKEEFEGTAIDAFIVKFGYYNKNIDHIFKNIDSDLLRFLQTIHDEYHPNQWRKKLEIASISYKLDTKKILKKFDQGRLDKKNKK